MSRYNQGAWKKACRANQEGPHELNAAIANHSNTRFQRRWPTWKTMLAQIAKESEVCPEVPVALLGPTGAGKSTLINALLDAQLLPVNVAKICTASVTEVAYSESPAYEATIEFVTEDEGRDGRSSRASWRTPRLFSTPPRPQRVCGRAFQGGS